MKNLLLITLIALAFGCSKSSNNTGPKTSTTTASYTGKFHMYRLADTVYNNSNISDGVEMVTVRSFAGDTTYSNPGTNYYKVHPNPIMNYSPLTSLGDTLSFTSSTKGIEYDHYDGAIPFTYSFKTGLFTEDGEDPGETEVLSKIDDSTLELIITLRDPNAIRERFGSYYKKF